MDIGFYLLDITADNDQQNKIIDSINGLCKKRPYDNIVLFNNQFARIDNNKKYYILHVQQAKYFNGVLFVFDTRSAMITQTFPAPKKQIMCINDPEWTRSTSLPYSFWHNIYMKSNVEIVANNQASYDICDICWKKPIHLMNEINYEEFDNVLSKL